MINKWVGLIASVAMLAAGAAGAHGMDKDKTATGTGGSGHDTSMQGTTNTHSGTMDDSNKMDNNKMDKDQHALNTAPSATMGANELTGRVVRVDNKMVWIEHMGAVLPLKIDSTTRFSDPTLKRARDIKEGQEIRAAFTVKDKVNNVATAIMPSAGTGGSGILQDQNLPSNDQGSMNRDTFNKQGVDDKSGSMNRDINKPAPLNDQSGTHVGGTTTTPSGNY